MFADLEKMRFNLKRALRQINLIESLHSERERKREKKIHNSNGNSTCRLVMMQCNSRSIQIGFGFVSFET